MIVRRDGTDTSVSSATHAAVVVKLRARRVDAARASAETAGRSRGLLNGTALARPRRRGTDDTRRTGHDDQVGTLAPCCLSRVSLHLVIMMMLVLLEDLTVVHMVMNMIVVRVMVMLLLGLLLG